MDASLVVLVLSAADVSSVDVDAATVHIGPARILSGHAFVHIMTGDSVSGISGLAIAHLQGGDTEGVSVTDVISLTAVRQG